MPETSELQLPATTDGSGGGAQAVGHPDIGQPKQRHVTRLFDLRIIHHETQRQVAAAIGVAAPTYGAWERGDRELKAENMKALARHFHVTPNEILGIGEVAVEIPRFDSRLEGLIRRWEDADPEMRNMVFKALEYGSKSRKPLA